MASVSEDTLHCESLVDVCIILTSACVDRHGKVDATRRRCALPRRLCCAQLPHMATQCDPAVLFCQCAAPGCLQQNSALAFLACPPVDTLWLCSCDPTFSATTPTSGWQT